MFLLWGLVSEMEGPPGFQKKRFWKEFGDIFIVLKKVQKDKFMFTQRGATHLDCYCTVPLDLRKLNLKKEKSEKWDWRLDTTKSRTGGVFPLFGKSLVQLKKRMGSWGQSSQSLLKGRNLRVTVAQRGASEKLYWVDKKAWLSKESILDGPRKSWRLKKFLDWW